jgi:hypothetical protein
VNVDVSVNVVVFEVVRAGKSEKLVGKGPTRAADCIQKIWTDLAAKHTLTPADIKQIYSEWEPSPEDKAFLDATFASDLPVSFSFARPTTEEGWELALQQAEAKVREVAARRVAEEALRGERGELSLVLRTYDAPDPFAATVVHRPIGANLAVYLAHVAWTPRKTLGIHYLLQNNMKPPMTPETAYRLACSNFVRGLRIEGRGEGAGRIFLVRHALDMGASALGMPDFYQNASGWAETAELFVAFTDPGTLLVTALTNESVIEPFRKAIQASEYWGAVALTPACYRLDTTGLTLIQARVPQQS